MDTFFLMQRRFRVSIEELHLCLQSLEGVTSVRKKRQLLLHAKEHILDIELALEILGIEVVLEIENQSEATLLLLATVHEQVTLPLLQMFTKAELRELRRQRQVLMRELYAQLSSIEVRSVERMVRMIRSTSARLSAPKAQVAALEEMLNS